MKRKLFALITAVSLLSAAVNPLEPFAASYLPAELYHQEHIAETVMKTGQTIYLFHSGTEEIRRIIQPNDILTVYRISPSCEVRTVGAIKVISSFGETYFKAEVAEGEIRPNDIVRKGNISCLVISAASCNK